MVKIRPSRTYKLPYQDKDDPELNFSVTFHFVPSEEISLDKIRRILKAKDEEEDSGNAVDVIIRQSITEIEGFINEETMEPIILRPDGKTIDENIQKIVFDVIKSFQSYYFEVLCAYIGPKGKNLLTGRMPVSTGSGDQKPVSDASSDVPV